MRDVKQGGRFPYAFFCHSAPVVAFRDEKAAETSREKISSGTFEQYHSRSRSQRRDTLNCLLENKDEPTFRLNPRWVEWLMNWPIGWTDRAPLPPERFKDWEQKSLDQSWWDVDPADEGIPRIAEDFKLRKPQLIAIGNGQVPTQIVLAEHWITQWHLHRRGVV